MPFVLRKQIPAQHESKCFQKVKQEQDSYFSQDQEGANKDRSDYQNHEGRWSYQQNLKFILFVAYYQNIFASKYKRKNSKIFKTFSDYMNERTPAQCRSHFQKLLVKYKTVAKIKKHFIQLYGKEQFFIEYERFKQEWEKKDLKIISLKEIGIQTEQIFIKKELLFNEMCINPFQSRLKTQQYFCYYPYIIKYE